MQSSSAIKSIILIFVILLTLSCTLVEDKDSKTIQTDFIISGEDISYKGQALILETNVKSWVAVLGEPTRRFGDNREIYVWDDIGVICYFDNDEGRRVSSFAIAFRERELHFWPKQMYSGAISVDGAIIAKDTPRSRFNDNKQRPKFRKGYFATIYHYDVGKNGAQTYVRVDLNRNGEIAKFSMSK